MCAAACAAVAFLPSVGVHSCLCVCAAQSRNHILRFTTPAALGAPGGQLLPALAQRVAGKQPVRCHGDRAEKSPSGGAFGGQPTQSSGAGLGHQAAKPEWHSRQSQQPAQQPRHRPDPAISSRLRIVAWRARPRHPVSRGLACRTFVASSVPCFLAGTTVPRTPGVWCQYHNVTSAIKLLQPAAAARGLLREHQCDFQQLGCADGTMRPLLTRADAAALPPGARPPARPSAICQQDSSGGQQRLAGSHRRPPPSQPRLRHELAAVHIDTPPPDAAVQQRCHNMTWYQLTGWTYDGFAVSEHCSKGTPAPCQKAQASEVYASGPFVQSVNPTTYSLTSHVQSGRLVQTME